MSRAARAATVGLPGALVVACTAIAWIAVFALGRGDAVTMPIGLVAAAAIAATALGRPAWLRSRLRGGLRDVAVGMGLGVALVLATRGLWPLLATLLPTLPAEVDALYAQARAGADPLDALPWILLAITAEEVVYRGLLFDLVEERGGPAWAAVVLSTSAYAISHAAAPPLLAIIAAAVGLVWAMERALTGSLVAPLISHAIWTLATVVFLPLR